MANLEERVPKRADFSQPPSIFTIEMDATTQFLPRASTGVAGLDGVLTGGLGPQSPASAGGSPGTGKTTIALQFLIAGAKAGESGVYVSLAETEQELRDGARSHGWIIGDKVEVFELVPPESVLDPDQHQSLLYSSDLELGETIQRIFEAIDSSTVIMLDDLTTESTERAVHSIATWIEPHRKRMRQLVAAPCTS